jgi:hypothetical protein
MPERIRLSRARGWRKPEGAVVVARPTRWGNPFRLWGEGSVVGPEWAALRERALHRRLPDRLDDVLYSSHGGPSSASAAREQVIDLFRTYVDITRRDAPEQFEAWVAPLRGKDLACWCPLDLPCHADVLLEVANGGDGAA